MRFVKGSNFGNSNQGRFDALINGGENKDEESFEGLVSNEPNEVEPIKGITEVKARRPNVQVNEKEIIQMEVTGIGVGHTQGILSGPECVDQRGRAEGRRDGPFMPSDVGG